MGKLFLVSRNETVEGGSAGRSASSSGKLYCVKNGAQPDAPQSPALRRLLAGTGLTLEEYLSQRVRAAQEYLAASRAKEQLRRTR